VPLSSYIYLNIDLHNLLYDMAIFYAVAYQILLPALMCPTLYGLRQQDTVHHLIIY
jgi:hypothetical protein